MDVSRGRAKGVKEMKSEKECLMEVVAMNWKIEILGEEMDHMQRSWESSWKCRRERRKWMRTTLCWNNSRNVRGGNKFLDELLERSIARPKNSTDAPVQAENEERNIRKSYYS